MNDLMTKSFLSYVDLKKQAEIDAELERDIEQGQANAETSISRFFKEVSAVKTDMEEITNLLFDLQNLNEESKSVHSTKLLRGLRDRMESDTLAVLRKAKTVKTKLENLDPRKNKSERHTTSLIRTRRTVTNGLKAKLGELMNDFQSLREEILSDYKKDLRRRYFNFNGEDPSEEMIENMVGEGGKALQTFAGRDESALANSERYDAVMDIQKSLSRLHQIFLDMAIMVDAQGESINDIEKNVAIADEFVNGGTNSLFYAKQMKKKGKKWVFWVWGVMLIILLVCFIALLTS